MRLQRRCCSFAGGSAAAGPCSILRWMWLEFSRCSRWAAVGRLLRSDSRPVSRGGRPNISRNELVMLPSASAIDRWSSGMNVNGSGIGLEYFSVVPGDLAEGVDQHLGLQPAQRIVREIGLRPPGSSVLRNRGKLVGLRVQDQPVDVLEVVAGRDQFLLQVGQQFGIDRRIVRADVVGLVDDAAAQQPGPDAVRRCCARTTGSSASISQSAKTSRGSRSGGKVDRRAVGKDRPWRRSAGLLGIEEDDLLLPFGGGLVADPREEDRHAAPAAPSASFSARAPMNVSATAWARACGSRLWIAR